MPNYVYPGFNVTGDPAGLRRFTQMPFRPVTAANSDGPTESGFAPTRAVDHSAPQSEDRVVVGVVACYPGSAGGSVCRIALANASLCDAGARRSKSADTFGGSDVDNLFGNVRASANDLAADIAADAAATQRVYDFFYRMRAVYRAGSGFASRGSLNPVGKGRA